MEDSGLHGSFAELACGLDGIATDLNDVFNGVPADVEDFFDGVAANVEDVFNGVAADLEDLFDRSAAAFNGALYRFWHRFLLRRLWGSLALELPRLRGPIREKKPATGRQRAPGE
jgi:hypothetical protein